MLCVCALRYAVRVWKGYLWGEGDGAWAYRAGRRGRGHHTRRGQKETTDRRTHHVNTDGTKIFPVIVVVGHGPCPIGMTNGQRAAND